jgi:type VI secretion system protein ImpA
MLDAEDDNDPTMRINSVTGLAGADVLRRVRLAPLTESVTFGRLCLRDIAIAEGETAAPAGQGSAGQGTVPDKATVTAAFMDTKSDVLAARLAIVRKLVADVSAIGSVFDDHTPGYGPSLDPLLVLLRRAVKVLAEAVGEPDAEGPVQDTDAGAVNPAAAVPVSNSGSSPGAINSAVDVRQALDRLIDYYEKFEPSSPLPLLLYRARRLVGADFMTIMRDLAPSGVESVNTIRGVEDVDES